MLVVEKMGKNRRIEFNPASTDFIDWLTFSFRLFTEILQLITCWLGKEKRVKSQTLELPGMSNRKTFMKKKTRVSELGTKNN